MTTGEGGKYYFVADVHLGVRYPGGDAARTRFLNFLDSLPQDTDGLFLLGDIFDFWVEYKDAIPDGYEDVLSRFRKLTDRGCRVVFFRGNHDYWTLDYFSRELGMEIVEEDTAVVELNGLRICLGHGDVQGCTVFIDKLLFFLMHNKLMISLLRMAPRRVVKSFGLWWSSQSRKKKRGYQFELEGSGIVAFAERMAAWQKVDHFIFGHYHKAAEMRLECGSTLHILGDWSEEANYLNLSGMVISGRGQSNIHS